MSKKGIDISYANAGINFDEIKNNYDFIIIRAGFTGWGDGVTSHKDDWFEYFYNQAKIRGIPVGVYFYSCANNYQKGVNEAQFLYDNCLKGKQFEYPVYMDVEDEHHQLNKAGVTDAIHGFCQYLEKLGYYVGVYANLNYFRNYIDLNSIKRYDLWLAFPDSGSPNFEYPYGMLQDSWRAKVSGITTDTDVSYNDYPAIIKNAGLNGYNNSSVNHNVKDINTIAHEVIQGLWGNGHERYNRLIQAGYNYNDVQNAVNQLLNHNVKDINNIAHEVIQGLWGNGDERYNRLTQAGYNYDDVQNKVNELMR